ncbi:hypothetical protein [Streptomyces sp. NBC_01565]|nr:hypothetical protein [Streptomyces sp. NBC_01565]MCX4546512.1 hypothetical protein [Streptomyces sp. NBC_01565]
MTTPPTYPSSGQALQPPECPHCGAASLPLGGSEGGATVHQDGCPREIG